MTEGEAGAGAAATRVRGGAGEPAGRHVSSGAIANLLAHVRREAGETGVDQVLALAGESRSVADLEEPAGWTSYEEGRRLFEAAVAVLEDPRALRRIGEGAARSDMTGEVAAVLQSLGGPAQLLEQVDIAAAKFCTVVRMAAVEVGTSSAVVQSWNLDGFPRFPALCDFVAGMLTQVTMPFDLPPADVVEVACSFDGAARCEFRVEWDAGATPEAPGDVDADRSLLARRFEAFQETAADLVAATDVTEVLARITARAGLAVRAPRHLLVVRPLDQGEPQVHHVGFTSEDEAEALARSLLDDTTQGDEHSRLVADIASATRHYGRLAAISETGTGFFPAERTLLQAYAGLAAAALDAATGLEQSRRQTTTAKALFGLARELTSVLTVHEIADRLAAAVRRTVECDTTQVWINEPDGIRLHAADGLEPGLEAGLRAVTVKPDDTELLRSMRDLPEPMLLTPDRVDAFLGGLMESAGVAAAAVAPITVEGALLGVISVSVRQDPGRLTSQGDLTERMAGLADIASTALQNARLVEQIRHQALYDAVTGLPNKRLLEERAESAFRRLRRASEPFSLMFIDLDRFKKVNDTLGHGVGDVLLEQVGRRLSETLREEDTIARLGGDEFAILLPGVGSSRVVERVAERIYAALQEPFFVEDQPIFITCSIGIAVAPHHGEDHGTLLRNADIAMYSAKEHGRNRYAMYSPALTTDFEQRLRLESDLHLAVERQEFVVHYQPQFDIVTRRPVGVEALVRWQHPELGLLYPDRFLGLAEETNLIIDIDLQVLRTACEQARAWADDGVGSLHVAVNVSHQSLLETDFAGAVAEVLASTRLDPRFLEIEITEQVVESQAGHVLDALHQLRELGVRLAVDDFGTGNSGLARLRSFPIDTLKIDRSFVSEVGAGSDAPLLAAMMRLGADLGFTVVAEGVETEEQMRFLRDQPCQNVQGYLLSRPLPHGQLNDYLRDADTPTLERL